MFSEVPQLEKIFDRALEKNWNHGIEKQYPKNWSDRVVLENLNNIIEGK